jgi:hypothetical protein
LRGCAAPASKLQRLLCEALVALMAMLDNQILADLPPPHRAAMAARLGLDAG